MSTIEEPSKIAWKNTNEDKDQNELMMFNSTKIIEFMDNI